MNTVRARVYFVASIDLRRVKIGKTLDLETRVFDLQSQNAHPLILIADVVGYTYVEKHFHAHFASERLHGEWFVCSLRLIETVCAIRREGSRYSARVAPLALAADGIEWTPNGPQGLKGRGRYLAQMELYKGRKNASDVRHACKLKMERHVE